MGDQEDHCRKFQ